MNERILAANRRGKAREIGRLTNRLARVSCGLALVLIQSFIAGCNSKSPETASSDVPSTDSRTSDGTSAAADQPDHENGATGGASEPTSSTEDGEEFVALAALPETPPVPADNHLTPAKIALGRLLFYDDRLSGDVGTSCASCHDSRIGWGDGNPLSRGYAGTQHWRNSQTIVNSAYLSKLFWAGEAPSLEAQASSAITGNLAGNGDPVMIEERLAQIPKYVKMFQEAFGVRRPSYGLVLKAIASFERAQVVSVDSPFDQYMRGDHGAMSDGALRGMQLFKGKAHCFRCHNGPLLSDERYHRLDLPHSPLYQQDPLRQIAMRFQFYARGVPEPEYRSADRDLGLFFTTRRETDKGKFRTPPLRYLVYTAPYMHNGVLETLEDVIDFYDQGGGDPSKRSPLLEPLRLTEDEKFDLLEFLESLSGDEIRIPPPELPPYEPLAAADETRPADVH